MLVNCLRDRSIEQHDLLLSGKLRSKHIQDLQDRVAGLPPAHRALLREVLIDALDVALHDLLFAFQDAHDRGLGIEIMVDGMSAAEASGMLQGEPLGPDGWISRFSKFPKEGS